MSSLRRLQMEGAANEHRSDDATAFRAGWRAFDRKEDLLAAQKEFRKASPSQEAQRSFEDGFRIAATT
jgi:hypothetical protein